MPELKAGDIGAVAKLKETRTSDTLAEAKAGLTFPPITWPEPVLAYAIEPKSRGDEDKISTAMHRLEEEDGASTTPATPIPTSCCCPARASCTSRSRSPSSSAASASKWS